MHGLEVFLGEWRLDRDIRHGDGSSARFEGRAVWRRDGAGAVCEEAGELILPQGRFRAERRYLWGEDLVVRFEDGRYFHQVPPEGGHAAHWCDPDQYDVWYEFALWPVWTARWRVGGPRKEYEMLSRYTRG
ncbi:DUF6314 family protein [Salipiger marinus]|uniref:DUF6314 family protein n=1 Tax=Salipiger marinus TaxID=555512 RepID=UPI001E3C2439|nr:DUF6314 family protein [Salipiger manganoxidans]